MGWAITCHQSLPLVDSAKSWSCGLLKGLIKQPKNRICDFFTEFYIKWSDLTVLCRKVDFLKKKKNLYFA